MTPPTPRQRLLARPACLAAGLCLAAAGCVGQGEDPLVACKRTVRQLERENAALTEKQLQLQQRVEDLQKQVAALQGLPPDRMAKLFTVERIELGRYTAGANLDDKPGDDGVRVYLQPIDRDGHVIKAAGTVSLQLFDLSRPDGNLIGRCDVPAEAMGKYWFGGLGRSHYRFDLPWTTRPATAEVTVRASFTDLLTGKAFTAQKVCTVTLAPSP
ncbi:MAG TPA: hypothetical protein VFJ30_15190 [Phycisphaerae bacterium]|nr:hypothetical protein [Phycisphaerae bacterium]